ncbi:sensor histidine kinase [Ideonella sp. YS5]|uniref:sensor histidine kinase n=1 Tax=Ideonella sp. YS5 TaxID=3453714 RepID=UPI003EECD336
MELPPSLRGLGDSLQARLALLLLVIVIATGLVHAAIAQWPLPQLLEELHRRFKWPLAAPAPGSTAALGLTLLLMLPFILTAAARAVSPLQRLLRALQGSVLSYREGDFSMSIRAQGSGDLGELLRLHSELGQALREQRQQLAQRELLLDTVVQNTPLALLLTQADGRIVYANIAARQLLAQGRSLLGLALDEEVLADAPADLRTALQSRQDQLFSVVDEAGHEEHFHLSQRALLLQGQPHRLVLLRRMTRELAREEVASWKRVIRVISHELNNSLAPISSLAHTGAELARRGQAERLPGVFESIGARAAHLHAFLAGYARFAKLPQPQPAAVDWPGFIERLAAHAAFRLEGAVPVEDGWFDAAQVEQALINLLKNAHESGSAPDEVALAVSLRDGDLRFTVSDRGPGMSETVLAQALLPFYSTKRSGTGLGLALAREIAESHGGRIALANREGGGLAVTLVLPTIRA